MWRRLRERFRGGTKQFSGRFQPLYNLDEIAACGRLPILRVLAFAGEDELTAETQLGPGVGGILASLLRRDMIFTRRYSVLGGEDTGYLRPDGNGAQDSEILEAYPQSAVIVVCQVRKGPKSRLTLDVRVLQQAASPAYENRFVLHAAQDQLSLLMPAVATRVCTRLGIVVTPALTERWQRHTLKDWPSLLLAARCWEQEDSPSLAKLLESGRVHPDAMVAINDDLPHRGIAHQALARANEIEPDNPQLAFCAFCALCNFHERSVPRRFETMLRAGLAAAPGHGKSHMVLPHILPPSLENIPYILAHSEVGYRLLPGNSFALSDFSNYLMQLAPQDERISPLFFEAIEYDSENPAGYENAIDFFLQRKQPALSLPFADALIGLCTPPISDRTWYCFRQYPSIAKLIDRGRFIPQKHAAEILNRCHAAMKRR